MQAFGNLSTVLAQPSAAKARQVPWVAALRGYGASVSASSAGLSFRYHLDTTGRSLSASQLPLAEGSASPSVVGGAPISAGIHDPAQIFSFVQAAEQVTSPASYAKFLKRQAATRAKTGVDINSFVGLLTGDLVIASDTKKTIGRVGVSNPAQASQDLAKLATTPNSLFAGATSVRKLPGGMYAVKRGKKTITVGVVGNQLVAGTVGPAALRAYAATPAAPPPGAQGSLAYRVALTEVLRLTLKQAPPKVAQTILGSLGDITGWTSASPSGLDGSAAIAVK
jgi:hypothetical protein